MTTNVDLNQARAARREAQGEAPTVTFGDPEQTFTLPVELPVEALEPLDELQASDGSAVAKPMLALLAVLLGEDYEAFRKLKPSLNDLTALFEGIMPLYGGDAGNSPASAA